MIPKVIHYCWLGHGQMSILHRRCIESWKKYCPDFELQLWTNENSDIDNEYCRQAIKQDRWALAADWVKFDVLYKHGGVYLDTDIELIKPLHSLIENRSYVAIPECETGVAAGFFAATPLHPINLEACNVIKNILIPNKRFSTGPLILTKAIELSDKQNLSILPPKTMYPFNPYDHNNPLNAGQLMFDDITEETVGIHHYGVKVSWFKEDIVNRLLNKFFPNRNWSISFRPL